MELRFLIIGQPLDMRIISELALSAVIVQNVENPQNGMIPLGNQSTPEDIYRVLNMSKSAFKRSVGHLYKLKLITIEDDRIILIADQFVCDGPIPPGFEEATDLHFDNAGEIAGSGLTLDIACANFMIHTGCSVVDAFRFGSYNPAKALNLVGVGYIEEGNYANLIFVDDKFNVKKTIFKGE